MVAVTTGLAPGVYAYIDGNKVYVQAVDEGWVLVVFTERPWIKPRDVRDETGSVRRKPIKPWKWVPVELVYP